MFRKKLSFYNYFLIASAITLLLFACRTEVKKQKGNVYTINGVVEPMESGNVLLFHISPEHHAVLIDSAKIEDHKFSFSGNTNGITQIVLEMHQPTKNPLSVRLFHEKGTVSVLMKAPEKDSDNPIIIKGAVTNDLYNSYIKQFSTIRERPEFLEIDSLQDGYHKKWQNGLTEDTEGMLNRIKYLSKKMYTAVDSLRFQFALKNKASALAPYIMLHEGSGFNSTTYSIAEMEEVFNAFNESYANTDGYKICAQKLEKAKSLEINKPAPDFELKTPEGNSITLSSFKKNYVLLEFWAYWCAPCYERFPELNKIHETYSAKGFKVLGVSDYYPDENQWKLKIEEFNISWPQAISGKTEKNTPNVWNLYDINNIPSSYLINPEGKIIAKNLTTEQLKSKLIKIYNNDDL